MKYFKVQLNLENDFYNALYDPRGFRKVLGTIESSPDILNTRANTSHHPTPQEIAFFLGRTKTIDAINKLCEPLSQDKKRVLDLCAGRFKTEHLKAMKDDQTLKTTVLDVIRFGYINRIIELFKKQRFKHRSNLLLEIDCVGTALDYEQSEDLMDLIDHHGLDPNQISRAGYNLYHVMLLNKMADKLFLAADSFSIQPDARTFHGHNLIHLAVITQQFQLIPDLIRMGVDLFGVDAYGNNLFHLAVLSGNTDKIRGLLETLSTIELNGEKDPLKILGLVALSMENERFEALTQASNAHGNTLVHLCAMMGRPNALVDILKCIPLDVSARNKLGMNALGVAIAHGHKDKVFELAKITGLSLNETALDISLDEIKALKPDHRYERDAMPKTTVLEQDGMFALSTIKFTKILRQSKLKQGLLFTYAERLKLGQIQVSYPELAILMKHAEAAPELAKAASINPYYVSQGRSIFVLALQFDEFETVRKIINQDPDGLFKRQEQPNKTHLPFLHLLSLVDDAFFGELRPLMNWTQSKLRDNQHLSDFVFQLTVKHNKPKTTKHLIDMGFDPNAYQPPPCVPSDNQAYELLMGIKTVHNCKQKDFEDKDQTDILAVHEKLRMAKKHIADLEKSIGPQTGQRSVFTPLMSTTHSPNPCPAHDGSQCIQKSHSSQPNSIP